MTEYKPNLIAAMEAKNIQEVNIILRQYKTESGGANFPKLFTIPKTERLPSLATKDFTRTNMLVIAALTMAFENFNVKRAMNELQILNLSEAIIDSASEDNLSFEDLMIFLQQFVRGRFPMSFESLDVPKFMKALDIYREDRWQQGIVIRDEKIAQWQGLGDSNRTAKPDTLSEHLSGMSGRLSEMKDALREKTTELKKLRDIDKF